MELTSCSFSGLPHKPPLGVCLSLNLHQADILLPFPFPVSHMLLAYTVACCNIVVEVDHTSPVVQNSSLHAPFGPLKLQAVRAGQPPMRAPAGTVSNVFLVWTANLSVRDLYRSNHALHAYVYLTPWRCQAIAMQVDWVLLSIDTGQLSDLKQLLAS